MNDKSWVDIVAEAINQSGLSDKEISKATGITVQTINRWKRKAVKGIRTTNIRLLSSALPGEFVFEGDGTLKYIHAVINDENAIGTEDVPSYSTESKIDPALTELLSDENVDKHEITHLEKYMLMRISTEAKLRKNPEYYLSILYSLRSKGKEEQP
jgi:hypothetical protein